MKLILITALKITTKTNRIDIEPNKFSLFRFKISKKIFNISLAINAFGLMKIFTKGINIAIEIDSVNEDKRDKKNSANNCFFFYYLDENIIFLKYF